MFKRVDSSSLPQAPSPKAPPSKIGAPSAAASSNDKRPRRARPDAEAHAQNQAFSGFVTIQEVRRRAEASHLLDIEPTAEQMHTEQHLFEQGGRRARPKPQGLDAAPDVLAHYMAQLAGIPLFTPQTELAAARRLESLELRLWEGLLSHPKAVKHLQAQSGDCEAAVRRNIEALSLRFARSAARSHRRTLAPCAGRKRLICELAVALRFADFDKDLLERVMGGIRRDVWGRRVLSANYAYRLTHADLTSLEQARGLATRARNDFVRANLRLVISVARRFHHYKVAFIDLIQEGNVGLLKAVHRFDHRRGFRFSTYAHWWIRQSIERAMVNKGSEVRLPVHVLDARRHINRAASRLTQDLGRAPTTQEIGTHLQLPTARVDTILAGIKQDPVSLDDQVGTGDSRKLLDLVHDDHTPAVDEALIRENTHARIRELLHLLSPMEKDIIRRRFGLGNDTDQTLDEIGRVYNLSRERVRQIQAQGLTKIRRMCERRQIG